MFWSFVRWKKHIYTSCSEAEMKVLSFFIWKSQYCVEKVQWWWLWLSQGWRVQGRSTELKGEIIATEKLEASPLVILPRIIKGHHEFSWIVVFFLMTAIWVFFLWGSWAPMDWAMGCKPTWGAGHTSSGFLGFLTNVGAEWNLTPTIGEDNLDWFFRAFNSTRIYEIFLKRALDFSEVGWSLESSRLQVDASCVSIINRNVGGDLLLKTWKTDLGVECIGFFSRGSPRFYGFIVWTSIIGGSVTQVSW